MNTKTSLRDRRRKEARDALYRAHGRRDHLIDALVRNTNHIKRLMRTLVRLGVLDPKVISKKPVSVAEGKVLEEETIVLAADLLDDDISDVPPCK